MFKKISTLFVIVCMTVPAVALAETYSIANFRGGNSTVFSRTIGSTYNYDPSVIYEDGKYRMWFCGNVLNKDGDHILYAESTSLAGPWHAKKRKTKNSFDVALSPTGNIATFDYWHVCNPSVIKVGSTYYMYYVGSAQSVGIGPNAIGVASSLDGYTWSRLNGGLPIIETSFKVDRGLPYGAGVPTVSYVNGKFYMMYIDTTGAASYPNGAGEYLIRSGNPLFATDAEIYTAAGFVPQTSQNTTSHIILNGINVDMAHVPAWNKYLIVSHADANMEHVILLDDQNFSPVSDLIIPSTAWNDGPGLVTTASRQAIMSSPDVIKVDVLRAVGNGGPFYWTLAWRGADVTRSQ